MDKTMLRQKMIKLDEMRSAVLEVSRKINKKTEDLSATELIEVLSSQRSMLIDYIMRLETFIEEMAIEYDFLPKRE